MNRRIAVIAVAVLALVGFAAAGGLYGRFATDRQDGVSTQEPSTLVRPHSPVIGPADAPVTIVEFFDPSCEACRAFYPTVKQILAAHPEDVRLVLRYTPFHQGSEEAVRILETARMQGIFEPVLEAVLASQPEWHDDPRIQAAWAAAEAAGLDVEKAREAMLAPQITATLNQDVADVEAVSVTGTPTFFVNGKRLQTLGTEQLYELVRAEIEAARQLDDSSPGVGEEDRGES